MNYHYSLHSGVSVFYGWTQSFVTSVETLENKIDTVGATQDHLFSVHERVNRWRKIQIIWIKLSSAHYGSHNIVKLIL